MQETYFVLTVRIFKTTNRNQCYKNEEHESINGPFFSRVLAERAVTNALGTNNCVKAQLLTLDQLESLDDEFGFFSRDLNQQIIQFIEIVKA